MLVAGCGQKGDPRPPLRPYPGALGDVAVRRIDDRVELRFTLPAANEDGTTPSAIERVEIYRAVSAKDAPRPDAQDVRRSERLLARLDVRRDGDGTTAAAPRPGERVTHVDRIADLAPAPAPSVLSYVLAGVIGGRRRATDRFDVPLDVLPAPPSEVTFTWTDQSVVLAWQSATGTDAFRVYEVDSTGRPREEQPPSQPPLTAPRFESPVQFGVERCLVVRAVHTAGAVTIEGPASPPICRTPEDTFPPPAPANLNGLAGNGTITLVWDAVQAADLAGYIVLRADAAGATLTPVSEVVTGTTFADSGVTPGTSYRYAVVAVDRSPRRNRSAASNAIEVVAR
jgi:hypothetical protein